MADYQPLIKIGGPWNEGLRLEGHEGEVTSIAWSPNGTWLASASGDQTVRIWNVRKGKEEQRLEGHWRWVGSVAWSPYGAWLASASGDQTAVIWNVRTWKEEIRLEGYGGSVYSVDWSPNGKKLATASEDQTVRIWNVSGKEEHRLDGHGGWVSSVAWNPTGTWLASTSYDQTVRIWNVNTGEEEHRLRGHWRSVYSVAWSPNGKKLATASEDQTVRIWNVSGKEEQRLKGHLGSVYSVAWSPDRTRIASASEDQTVRIWNVRTGKEEQRLEGHGGAVYSVAWSPDGNKLATVSEDQTVQIWRGCKRYTDAAIQPALIWSEEKEERLYSAAKAWGRGDVYGAWKQIEETCQAPWVGEVLSELDLTEATRTQRSAEEEAKRQDDRARKIREAIQQKVQESLDPENPPPLEESLPAIERFLQLAPAEDEAIAWLRDSACHTLERQKSSKKEALKVAILGEFSSGKSRLINALLEEKILSVGLVPVTRSVTRIIHGKKIRVTVKHMDGTTVEVAPDQLKAYTDERKKEEGASEVDEVILEHPSPILKQVEIWDTPGFNSNNQLHDQVASQLMLESDAVLWVIAGHQVGSRSETKLLETVKRAQGKVVGVLNQVDRLENEEAIERQKQEVWTHYGEMVKEVVTTSGKWLEAGKPEGNRQELLAEIEKIGSWSQEQRARKTARRVAAVAEECLAWFRLNKEEEKTLKDLQLQNAEAGMQQRTRATQLWKEAISHRDQLHKPRKDEEDRWWKSHCAGRTPLTQAYEVLLSEKLSLSEFDDLKKCIAVLEEANWHLSPHDPVPWREDFLIAWRQGNQIQEELPEVLFSSGQISCRHKRDLLDDLIMMDQPSCLERHHGSGLETPKPGKITEVVEQISKASEVDEAWNWALSLKNVKPQQIKIESVDPPKICGISGTHLSRNCAPLRNLKKLDQFIPAFEKLQQMVQESYRNREQESEPIRQEELILLDQKMAYSKIIGETPSDVLNLVEDRLMKLRSVQKNLQTIKAGHVSLKSEINSTIKSLEEDAKQIDLLWEFLYKGNLSAAKDTYGKLKTENKQRFSPVLTFIRETKKDVWFGYARGNKDKYWDLLPVGSVISFAIIYLCLKNMELPLNLVIPAGLIFVLVFPIFCAILSLKTYSKSGKKMTENITYAMTNQAFRVSHFQDFKTEFENKISVWRDDLKNLEDESLRLQGIDHRIHEYESMRIQIALRQKNYEEVKREFETNKCSLLEQLASSFVEKEQPNIV